MATAKKRKKLTDEQAVAFMVLHHGHNPVRNVSGFFPYLISRGKMRDTVYLFLHPADNPVVSLLASELFASEAEAAQRYCEVFELGGD